MTDQNRRLLERCADADMCVQRIVHVDTMTLTGADDDLIPWIGTWATDALNERYGWDLDDSFHPDEIREALNEVSGWLVEASQADLRPHPDDPRGYWPTWGTMTTRVFHGDTYDDAIEKALAWAEGNVEAVTRRAFAASR